MKITKDYGNSCLNYCVLHLFLNKIAPIQGSTIKIQLLSARFSLIITTFAISNYRKIAQRISVVRGNMRNG